jgi:BirA family biotin operon repressor/biotin-[acetyl-CoA-carboxylase] ligase
MNEVIESCQSTNDLARAMGETGAPHGSWISARVQTSGRGRLGRKWESQEGNLFLSMIARIEDRGLFTWIPLVTAMGIAETLRKEGFPVEIKWPNDLWIARKKLGGILCEAIGNSRESFVVIGMGLNCAFAPEGLDQETVSLSIAAEELVTADDVRLKIVDGVKSALSDLISLGTAHFRERYRMLAAFKPGTPIEWGESGKGVVHDLGSLGELIVLNAQNELIKLYAEDVKIRIAR